MADSFKRYTDGLLRCLGTYQFIEEALRFCLIRCHATTKFRLEGFLAYEVPLQAIEDAALGRLIDWYKMYTDNADLIRDLRKIKSARDHVAHQGLALTLEEQADDVVLLQKIEKIEQEHSYARNCFDRLVKEMEATDVAVNRAYQTLKNEYVGRGQSAPAPFKVELPDTGNDEP